MANSVSHAALPFVVKGARYTVAVPFIDADGDPTDPTTPDTERSLDGAAFADCTEEVTTISGSNGSGYITLTGAETNCSLLVVCAKVASGPKATLLSGSPRVLPTIVSGTATAGAAGSITLEAGTAALNLAGCILKTTGGTGGGGTGGADNQARVITAYNTSTRVATVVPDWETNPASGTTYDVLRTEMACPGVPDDAPGAPGGLALHGGEVTVADGTEVTINSPVLSNEKIDIVQGSDYYTADGRDVEFNFTGTGIPAQGSETMTLSIASGTVQSFTTTSVLSSGSGSANFHGAFQIDRATGDLLDAGTGSFDVFITIGGHQVPLIAEGVAIIRRRLA